MGEILVLYFIELFNILLKHSRRCISATSWSSRCDKS